MWSPPFLLLWSYFSADEGKSHCRKNVPDVHADTCIHVCKEKRDNVTYHWMVLCVFFHTYLLRCMWQRACPAFLCPGSGSAAPGWKDRRGRPDPSFHLSPCLFLGLCLSPVRKSAAAGAEPRAGVPWQSQQQPGNREQTETKFKKLCLFKTISGVRKYILRNFFL